MDKCLLLVNISTVSDRIMGSEWKKKTGKLFPTSLLHITFILINTEKQTNKKPTRKTEPNNSNCLIFFFFLMTQLHPGIMGHSDIPVEF